MVIVGSVWREELKMRGTLTLLELEEKYAQLAAQNLAKAGFPEQVTYLTLVLSLKVLECL